MKRQTRTDRWLHAVLNESVRIVIQHIPPSGGNGFRCQTRAKNCLENANIQRVGDLVLMSERELLKIKHAGKNTVAAIIEALRSLAEERDVPLSLGMGVRGWRPQSK